jgi:hypothetical protein
MDLSVKQKALDIAWDMWEQQNDVNQNTMHPRRAAAVEEIKAQLWVLYRREPNFLLPTDCDLF